MLHFPSDRYYQELASSGQLVRFALAEGSDGLEPTLLIKSTSLTLKYLIRGAPFRLILAGLAPGGYFLYAVRIEDDHQFPFALWSFVESSEELEAIKGIEESGKCSVFQGD